jgi:penicillin-binding protein 1C
MNALRRHYRILLSLAACLLIAGSLFVYFYIFHDLPDVRQIDAGLALPSTRIYDRHGALLYEILPPEQGRNRAITLESIPQACVNAVIAVEDANYWSHPGVDLIGIARALWINLRGGEVLAGGSTITQQTARLLLLDPVQRADRSLQRKLREALLAIRLQNEYSKAHVLELYLNQAYFGNLAYGIEAAARTYFHKAAPELAPSECALLAGILQNPVLHDPLTHLAGALERQQVALRLMVQNGYLTQAEADSASLDSLQFGSVRFPIEAPHFVMAVWQQLERMFPDELYRGGLDVVTTLDLGWQQSAQQTIGRVLERLNHPPGNRAVPANANNAALVALDPFTGQVLVMVGSPDYFNEEIDGAVNAALALRQPGSALKPFTYALALDPTREAPFTAATVLLDIRTPFVTARLESYTPANFGLVEHGPVSVREALASSYNIPAVLTLQQVGVQRFTQFAANIGLDSLASNPNTDLAITLGGGEVRLLDLVQAYSIFPNSGYRIDPAMILKVTTHDDRMLYEWQAPRLEERILDQRVAWLITDILSDNEARIPAFGPNSALQIGRPAAAKTGTTTDFRDNWVVGYTPNLVVGVWVGNADNTPMVNVTGVTGAGPIYNQFMRQVLLGQPQLEFQQPEGLLRVEVCNLSGLLPRENCPLRRVEWFIAGTEPTEYDTTYQDFAIDQRTGALADERTPREQVRLETFVVLPQQAWQWALRSGLKLPPQEVLLQTVDPQAALRLLEPDPYTIFEISSLTPLATQRLRFRAAVPPDTVEIRYLLNGEPVGAVAQAPWSWWWTLAVGEWEVSVEALLQDGSRLRSDPVIFAVEDTETPVSRTLLPGEQ